jgi:hypothetical protein
MKQLFFSLVAITLFSFKAMGQKENIEGSVYIKLIDIYNIIDSLSDTVVNQTNKVISEPNYEKKIPESEKEGYAFFKFLVENNFLHKPHFKLKMESGKIINVFVDEREYLKLKEKLKGFDKDKERINLKFEGVKKSDGFFKELDQAIYYADKITFVEKVLVETDWKK